jgi:ABC-type transport system substrate-binding protein
MSLNAVNADLPVLGLETPDNSTVVVKLAFPDSSILSILAWGWILNIVPVEAEDKFDTRQEMRGSGPWLLSEYQPSQGLGLPAQPELVHGG